jgi:hypothetical protein
MSRRSIHLFFFRASELWQLEEGKEHTFLTQIESANKVVNLLNHQCSHLFLFKCSHLCSKKIREERKVRASSTANESLMKNGMTHVNIWLNTIAICSLSCSIVIIMTLITKPKKYKLSFIFFLLRIRELRKKELAWLVHQAYDILLVRCGTHICQCQSSKKMHSHCLRKRWRIAIYWACKARWSPRERGINRAISRPFAIAIRAARLSFWRLGFLSLLCSGRP